MHEREFLFHNSSALRDCCVDRVCDLSPLSCGRVSLGRHGLISNWNWKISSHWKMADSQRKTLLMLTMSAAATVVADVDSLAKSFADNYFGVAGSQRRNRKQLGFDSRAAVDSLVGVVVAAAVVGVVVVGMSSDLQLAELHFDSSQRIG